MNTDFPRIITLLRKERNISQKQAAADLGVSQALLSHYEKGIRECGLEFLVKTADYYNVSCDYLLGRCAEPNGRNDISVSAESSPAPVGIRKILADSQSFIFSLIEKSGSAQLEKDVGAYLGLAIYRMFRVIYSANSRNDRRFFTVDESSADGLAGSLMELKRVRAEAAAAKSELQNTPLTTNTISEEYPEYASSILNELKMCEESINIIADIDRTE